MVAPSRTPGRVLAACALAAALTACGGAPQASEDDADGRDAASPAVMASPSGTSGTVSFGGHYRFANGMTVVTSTPKSFTPSSNAYPASGRALSVEMSLYNDGAQPYRLSSLTVIAKVDGVQAKQVVDPVQGYNGVVEADRDVVPGRNVRLQLAFAVPSRSAELTLSVRPESASQETANYRASA